MYISKGQLFFHVSYEDKDRVKSLPVRRWNPNEKLWSIPAMDYEFLIKEFPDMEEDIMKVIKGNNVQSFDFYDIKIDEGMFKRKPYPHQLTMTKNCIMAKRHALLCEMGTGKTQAIINAFQYLFEKEGVKMLIVCPKTLIENWGSEVRVNSNFHYEYVIGTKKKREKILSYTCEIMIINYEGVLSLKDYPHWDKFDMVVLDESSKIKNHQAAISKLIVKLFQHTPYKYILTGTPITQTPMDIYQQYKFLNPEFLYHKSFYSFRNSYAIMGGYGNYQVIGYKNIEHLRKQIDLHATQLKKEDCVALPEKIYQERKLEMPSGLARQYNEMKNNLTIEIDEDKHLTASIVLTKLLRLQQILGGTYIKERNEKLEALMEIIEEAGTGIVIWVRFIETLNLIKTRLDKEKISYALMHGDIKNRHEQIEKFQKKEVKVFLAQIQTGGLGITLTAGNVVVYFENTFSLENRLQSEDRCHRIGQKNNVLYIDLLYKNTIDEQIFRAIKSKQDIAHLLVSCFTGIRR